MQEGHIFNELPVYLRTLIVIGFVTLFIIFALVIALIFMFSFQKEEPSVNTDEFADFLNEYDSGKSAESVEESVEERVEEKHIDVYPTLPKITDLKGNLLKDLMSIKIVRNKNVRGKRHKEMIRSI